MSYLDEVLQTQLAALRTQAAEMANGPVMLYDQARLVAAALQVGMATLMVAQDRLPADKKHLLAFGIDQLAAEVKGMWEDIRRIERSEGGPCASA